MAPDPLPAVWNAALEWLGYSPTRLDQLEPEAAPGTVERLAALARHAGVRLRRVALAQDWWRRDRGPLIGFLAGDDRPVALLPRAWGGYTLVDSQFGVRRALSSDAALALAPFGFAVYRPFPPHRLGLVGALWFGLRPCMLDLTLLMLAGLAVSAVVAALALAGGKLVNAVVPSDEPALLVAFGAAVLVTVAGFGLSQAVRALALVRLAGRVRGALQAAVWDRLLDAPTPFFRRHSVGELAERAMSADALPDLVSGPAFGAALGLVTSLFSWALLASFDPLLALSVAALLGIFAGFAALLHARAHADRALLLEVRGRIASLAFQLLSGIGKLKVAAAERRAFGAWVALFERQHRLSTGIEWHDLRLRTLSAAMPASGLLAVLSLLAVRQNPLSPGDFVAVSAALTVVLSAVVQAAFTAPSVLYAVSAFERTAPILDNVPEAESASRHPGRLEGRIEIRGVTFRYASGGPAVLEEVSLRAEPGEMVAIVGPSGSGKSTLLRLLLGFELPSEGAVLYDDQELTELDTSEVRRQLGVVLQDSRLIPGATIFGNIAGMRNHTLDEAWEAARAAGIAEEIEQMPMGMHTFVAEGGSTFSGGQKQRLMIARAIISKPRIVYFDEATSALDNRAQAQVTTGLERLRATRIVIAHRLSTIAGADRVYVLDRGTIVQDGQYEELLAQPGPFRDLARRQLV